MTGVDSMNTASADEHQPQDQWLDAMWEQPALKPNERAVAYAYARYAGGGETTSCTWDELKRRTGIRSRDALSRAIFGLVTAGWLVKVEAARQHYSVRYQLAIPMHAQADVPERPEAVAASGGQAEGPAVVLLACLITIGRGGL
jgi:hypothetical protein